MTVSCEHCNEKTDFIKSENFLTIWITIGSFCIMKLVYNKACRGCEVSDVLSLPCSICPSSFPNFLPLNLLFMCYSILKAKCRSYVISWIELNSTSGITYLSIIKFVVGFFHAENVLLKIYALHIRVRDLDFLTRMLNWESSKWRTTRAGLLSSLRRTHPVHVQFGTQHYSESPESTCKRKWVDPISH